MGPHYVHVACGKSRFAAVLLEPAFPEIYDPRQSGCNRGTTSMIRSLGEDQALSGILVCPSCRRPMHFREDELECKECGSSYRVNEGILSLGTESTRHGEFSSDEMRELVQSAERMGWRQALETCIRPKNKAVLDLILDLRRSSFLDLLPGSGNDVALDIGCGYGGISLQLARRYGKVFAIDSGVERLGFLNVIRQQDRLANIVPIHHGNVMRLPFADDCADLIVLVGVFEYLPLAYPDTNIEKVQLLVLRELRRVLKKGGYLYLGTKNRFGWPYWRGAEDHNHLRFGPVLPRRLADWLTRRLYGKPYRVVVDSYPAYRKMIETAGFSAPIFYWPDPGYQFPNSFMPLHALPERSYGWPRISSWKEVAISILQSCGLLKFVAPHFSIVARKG